MSSLFFLPLSVSLLLGLVLGLLAARLLGRQAAAALSAAARDRDVVSALNADLRIQQSRLQAELAATYDRREELEADAERQAARYEEVVREREEARAALAAVGAELKAERAAMPEKLALVTSAREELADRFKALAGQVLEEKSKNFADHSQQLLAPLREKLGEFQLRVEALKEDGIAGRSELKTQIESLRSMNDKLSVGADNLVKALKGSSKTQGDWGEVLLAGILEAAGLRAGKEYRVQKTFMTAEGRHVRPDIILDLPQQKHLVIDSKVSLNSYTDYCACDDEDARKAFLDRHVRSVRDHIDGLSKKAYQGLHQLQSLDFVIMFIPIEPAYLLALAHDGSLWQRAWNKDVLLVSPSTLYPVLRTIQYAWQQERQTRNVEEIVRLGGALYDKVAGFAASFEDIGRRIGGVQTAYDKAWGQLASGRGHVMAQFEKLRELGIRTTKVMPASMVGVDQDDARWVRGAHEDAGLDGAGLDGPGLGGGIQPFLSAGSEPGAEFESRLKQ